VKCGGVCICFNKKLFLGVVFVGYILLLLLLFFKYSKIRVLCCLNEGIAWY
jgi:hypothetical protein